MAFGSIPFTITEPAGITRNGDTLSSMRFPIAVPLRQDENKTSSSAFRVIDTVTSAQVPAAFRTAHLPLTHPQIVGGARWGDYGNTGHRIKVCLVDLVPTLNANETRTYNLVTSGGTGDATGGITVTTNPAFYEVNTGSAGITARIPRTGAQSILSYLKLNALTGATAEVVNGTGGGLWMMGIAGAGPAPSPANNQAVDFFSNLDLSGDGTANGGEGDEIARPGKYFTSILFQNSQRVCIKIDTVRCVKSTGGAFQGMNREVAPNNQGTPTAQVATWDIYLEFFRNSTAIRRRFVFKSTGGDYDQQGGLRSDCAIEGMGDDIVTVFTGSMQIATRDETAASKIATVTSATAGTIRQRAAPAGTSYGFSLTKTGPLTFTGTPVTQLEACYDVTAADSSRGLLRIPWNWRNKYPMGWSHTPSTGRLRWEMLNPDQNDVDVSNTRSYHVILGHQWFTAEDWLVPHVGLLTAAQITDTVKALAGVHEVKTSGSYAPSTETGPGAQQTSLLGHCTAEHWDETRAWRRMPPTLLTRPDLLGSGGLLGLAGQLSGSVSKVDDVDNRLNVWMDTYHDATVSTNARSWRSYQSSWNGVTGPLGHRYYGGHPTSGSFQNCGANDYEYCSYPLYHWLRRDDRGDWAVAYEATLHCVTIDQFKMFYDTGAGAISGRLTDFNGHATTFHSSNRFQGFEYQQNFEAPSLLFLLTGEPIFYEALQHYLNHFNVMLYGVIAGGTILNTANRGGPTTATVSGNTLIVSDPTGFVAAPGSSISARPPTPYPFGQGGTLTSSGTTLTCSSVIFAYGSPGGGALNAISADNFAQAQSLWVGAIIRSPQGAGGQLLKVLQVSNIGFTIRVATAPSPALSGATWELMFHAGYSTGGKLSAINGTTLTVAWDSTAPTNGSTVTVAASPIALSRMSGWQLAALVGMAKCVGQTLTNAQGSHDLYARIKDTALHLLYTEQRESSAAAITQMGGCGTFGKRSGEVPQDPGFYGGRFGSQNHTYFSYPAIPLVSTHEFMELMVAVNLGTSIFTSTVRADLLNLLVRLGKHGVMGVDGLSPISGAAVLTARKIPICRGGDLASSTSFQAYQNPGYWCFCEEPERVARSGEDFLVSADDMNDLFATGQVHTASGAGTPTFMQSSGGTSVPYVYSDLLAYVAEKKWHATGDFPRRDLWLKKAMELGTSALCLGAENQPGFGVYVDPTVYPQVSSMFASNGAVAGGIRAKHWALKHGAYWMQLAKNGFGTGVADVEAPSIPANLHTTSKTDISITVACDASTDNVAVTGYRWRRGGVVQDSTVLPAYTYSGLTANTAYTLTVEAFDAVPNFSAQSSTLNETTLTAADTTPPTVPTGLAVTGKTTTTMTWGWTASTDSQSGIKDYDLEIDGTTVRTTTNTSLTEAGLAPGTLHSARVRARDNATTPNVSAYSGSVSDTTLTADTEAPTAPGAPSLVSRTSAQLVVDFPISTDNVGVVDYVVTAGVQPPVTVTAPPATISGLTANTEYDVSVVARDAIPNVSDVSPISALTTLRQARLFASGNTATATVVPIANYAFTLGIKFKPTALANQFLVSLGNHLTQDDWFAIKILVGGTMQALRSNSTGADPGATTSNTYSAGIWQRVIATFTEARSTIRLESGAEGENLTVKTFPTGLSRLIVGTVARLTPLQFYVGAAADLAIWDLALTPAEQANYLAGVQPWLIRRAALVTLNGLEGNSPELDRVGTSNLTLSGTTLIDGPEDAFSTTDPTPPGDPGVPGTPVEVAVTPNSATFSWTAGANAVLHRIRQSDTSVVFELDASTLQFTANGLLPFTSYSFTVSAVNSVGLESGQSTPLVVTTRPAHFTAASGRTLRTVITPRS